MFWRVMLYIDIFFLNKFQYFQNWTQKTFGLTCFWWAKFCAKLGYGAYILWIIIDCFVNVSTIDVVVKVLLITYWTVLFYRIMNYIERTEKNIDSAFLNEEIVRFPMRIALLFFSIWVGCLESILIIAGSYEYGLVVATFFCIVCMCYFNACTPLPPSESKVRQWLQNMKEKVTEILFPQPDLAPSQ